MLSRTIRRANIAATTTFRSAKFGHHTPTKRTIKQVELEILAAQSHIEFAMSSKSIEAFTAVQKNLKLLRQELKTLQRQEPKPANEQNGANPIINIRNHLQLKGGLEDCVLPKREGVMPLKFIGIKEMLADDVNVIKSVLSKKESGQCRKMPIVKSAVTRGGKTIALEELFLKLKSDPEIVVLYASFNGGSNYNVSSDENFLTQEVLGHIARQLIPAKIASVDSIIRVPHDVFQRKIENDLKRIQKMRMTKKIQLVVLIDELNKVGLPLPSMTSTTLKSLFLFPLGRAFVFSTHTTLNLEKKSHAVFLGNDRDLIVSKLPVCTSVDTANSMLWKPGQQSVTAAQVAMTGCNPALLYEIAMGRHSPYRQVEREIENYPKDLSVILAPLLNNLIEALLSGTIASPSKDAAAFWKVFSFLNAEPKQSKNTQMIMVQGVEVKMSSKGSEVKQWSREEEMSPFYRWSIIYFAELLGMYCFLSRGLGMQKKQICKMNKIEYEAIGEALEATYSSCQDLITLAKSVDGGKLFEKVVANEFVLLTYYYLTTSTNVFAQRIYCKANFYANY